MNMSEKFGFFSCALITIMAASFSTYPLSSLHKVFLAIIFSGYSFLFFFDGVIATGKNTRKMLRILSLSFFIDCYFSYLVFININKFEILIFYNVIVLFSLFLFTEHWRLKSYFISSVLGLFVAYFFERPFSFFEIEIKYFLILLFCLSYVFFMWFYYVKNKQKLLDIEELAMKEQAYSISHELSGILCSINLTLSSIKNSIFDDVTKKIFNKLERDVSLAQIFLEITKNNYREYLPNAKNEDLSIIKSIENLIEEYPLTNKEKKIIHIQGDDFIIKFDRLLIYLVLVNLLKNALFFIKKAGRGEIYISIEKNINQKHNALVFKDTGYGIKADYLPFVFDRFFSRRRHGTGMGLYFCKCVMQHYGGDIRVLSIEKEYTEFKLLFPANR